MLHEFITTHRDDIVARCRAKVAERTFPPEAEGELNGVPLFLGQLIKALGETPPVESRGLPGANEHGKELHRLGFTVEQVVHAYGNICQSVTDLAVELETPLANSEFRILNRCLDDAIAEAVTGFESRHDQALSDSEDVRLAAMADEQDALLTTAGIAFEFLKTGTVGIGGSTGALLEQSLRGLRALHDRVVAGLRSTGANRKP
jgi:hypothetical protein